MSKVTIIYVCIKTLCKKIISIALFTRKKQFKYERDVRASPMEDAIQKSQIDNIAI